MHRTSLSPLSSSFLSPRCGWVSSPQRRFVNDGEETARFFVSGGISKGNSAESERMRKVWKMKWLGDYDEAFPIVRSGKLDFLFSAVESSGSGKDSQTDRLKSGGKKWAKGGKIQWLNENFDAKRCDYSRYVDSRTVLEFQPGNLSSSADDRRRRRRRFFFIYFLPLRLIQDSVSLERPRGMCMYKRDNFRTNVKVHA